MSIFFPYDTTTVLSTLTDVFGVPISSLSEFEVLITTIIVNLYFFIFWFIIIYFALKLFNRIWERFF